MAAAMNGIAVHGGLIPYGGTFLTFTDYARPAIRLSALMGARVIYVMTHDSIGLGEDGPTHQPVEHLAALRAIPQLLMSPPGRPGRDRRVLGAGAEAARAPSLAGADPAERCRCCAREAEAPKTARRAAPMCWPRPMGSARSTLLATGSEVSLAMSRARGCWRKDGIARRRRFDALLGDLRQGPKNTGTRCSARRRASRSRRRCALAGTAGSARAAPSSACRVSAPRLPARRLFPHFGITPEKVAEAARSLL